MAYRDQAFPDRALHLHAARPVGWSPAMPVVFVHHGVRRNGRDYRDYWLAHVDAGGFLAIAIEFPDDSFPEYLWYHFGNLRTKDGAANPPEAWTFGIGPRLFQALRDQGITTAPRHGLFGHSAGGQYVHRMLSLGYREHVAVAVAANAGTYAMPDLGIAWPWGLGALGLAQADLPPLLGFPLTILAGTEDTGTTGAHFPKGPNSMRQGPHRYGRAHAYVRTGRQAAEALGMTLAWELIDVPGVGHDGARMSDAAAPLIAERLRR
ncbi:MAG TPA: alpha/beta hydrolase [Rhodopila sp.]|uniref:alpha/beta hydrolase n=1 Tax=Rhodopila sp. TaxID=2480087 RepID=UPI002BFF198C|nr:alpha/beta hydrolase [Rhodopila sp.]HVY13692.1 alpha/beta hydrolase [Rhodopila sp.]